MIAITQTIGPAPVPEPVPTTSASYEALFTPATGDAVRVTARIDQIGSAPQYTVASTAETPGWKGFCGLRLVDVLGLFSEDFALWLREFTAQVEAMEAQRADAAARVDGVHVGRCPNCGNARTKPYASDARQVVCLGCNYVYPRFSVVAAEPVE